MSNPTSTQTFEDLILRVAQLAGIAYYGSSGNERAMIPTNAHDLDLCKRVVNEAIAMFTSDAPVHGWRWARRIMSVALTGTRITGTADSASSTTIVDATLTATYDTDDDLNGYYVYITGGTGSGSYALITDYTAVTGTITVADWLNANGNAGGTDPVATDTFAVTPVETVGGDIARYPLPENFYGEYSGGIEYASGSNHATPIEWYSDRGIRRNRSISVSTGHPLYATIRPLEPVSNVPSPKRRFELFLDPQPSTSDTVEFPYTLHFDQLKLEAGTSSAGDATSLTDSTLANLYPDDYFNGWTIKIISGTGKFSNALVTDYTGSTGAFTVADWLDISGGAGGTDPGVSSVYIVQPVNNYHPAGPLFDNVILSACRARAEQEWDEVTGNFMSEYFQKDLPAAVKADLRSVPKLLGSMNTGTVQRARYRENVSYN